MALIVSVVESTVTMNEELEQNANVSAVLTAKDDNVCLLQLYKEPMTQQNWTDLYSVLLRPELCVRKSGEECAVAVNPLVP